MNKLPVYNFGYKKLIIYQKAFRFVLDIYKITAKLPKEEVYVLIPQIRRATVSIVANIVEGYSKSSKKEFARFLDISRASANEVGLFLDIFYELKYINTKEFDEINNKLIEIKKLVYSFQKGVKKSITVK